MRATYSNLESRSESLERLDPSLVLFPSHTPRHDQPHESRLVAALSIRMLVEEQSQRMQLRRVLLLWSTSSIESSIIISRS